MKYRAVIDAIYSGSIEVEAESEEEAFAKAVEYINGDNPVELEYSRKSMEVVDVEEA